MNAQLKWIVRAMNANRESRSLPAEDDLDLGLPENLRQTSSTLKEIFPVLLMFHTGWIEAIEYLSNGGLRFYIEINPSQMVEQTVQVLRKMLERAVNAPINIYWGSRHIDFVPI